MPDIKTILIALAVPAGVVGAVVAIGTVIGWTPIATKPYVVSSIEAASNMITPEVQANKKGYQELAGSLEILTKQQFSYEYRAVNTDIQQTETQLFEVKERLKDDPMNPDARVRMRQLETHRAELLEEKQRAKCDLLKLDRPGATC